MYDWCHSGLEGYCKAAARMIGDSVDGNDVLNFCRDILPDRTMANLTRAWTLSNERRGRDCRLSLFEKCWLDGRHGKNYVAEAQLLSKGEAPKTGFATIPTGSDYESELVGCRNADERAHTALSRCEADAIEACVKRILQLWTDDEEEDAASIASLVLMDDFSVDFFSDIVPAIERGLLSERYRSSDIQQFTLTLSDLVSSAHRCLVKDESDLEPFRRFLVTLVAGLIYGPNHLMAINRRWNDTATGYLTLSYEADDAYSSTAIRLTQIFDNNVGRTGYSELIRPTQVVFFGRCPDAEEYVRQCGKVLSEEPEALEAAMDHEKVVFPIASHAAVSNIHAMLLREGNAWWLFDLGSTNGTSILSGEEGVEVKRLVELKPGDRLRFGAPASARDANIYWDAATVLVSLHIDPSEESA